MEKIKDKILACFYENTNLLWNPSSYPLQIGCCGIQEAACDSVNCSVRDDFEACYFSKYQSDYWLSAFSKEELRFTIPFELPVLDGNNSDPGSGMEKNWSEITKISLPSWRSQTKIAGPTRYRYKREREKILLRSQGRQAKVIWKSKKTLLPTGTGIGERYSQTISNLGHVALLRRCKLPH